jgi:hypothetical protein
MEITGLFEDHATSEPLDIEERSHAIESSRIIALLRRS